MLGKCEVEVSTCECMDVHGGRLAPTCFRKAVNSSNVKLLASDILWDRLHEVRVERSSAAEI